MDMLIKRLIDIVGIGRTDYGFFPQLDQICGLCSYVQVAMLTQEWQAKNHSSWNIHRFHLIDLRDILKSGVAEREFQRLVGKAAAIAPRHNDVPDPVS